VCDSPEITIALEVLIDLLDFFPPSLLNAPTKHRPMKLAEVASLLSATLPFGAPADTVKHIILYIFYIVIIV
jgi:hypothetical protein